MRPAKVRKATTGNTNPVDMPAFFKNIPIAYPPGIPTTAVISNAIKVVKRPSSNDGMGGYIFRMPENMLKELAGYDCTYAIEIQAEAEYQEIIEQELKLLVSDNRDVRLQTLQDFIVEHQSDNRAGFTLAYAIAAILWIFAVINQINLTVTNLLLLFVLSQGAYVGIRCYLKVWLEKRPY